MSVFRPKDSGLNAESDFTYLVFPEGYSKITTTTAAALELVLL